MAEVEQQGAVELCRPVLAYINRLGDYLSTAARYDNAKRGVGEVGWRPESP